jgi:hypothetical protein
MATDGPIDHARTCPSLRATVTPTWALFTRLDSIDGVRCRSRGTCKEGVGVGGPTETSSNQLVSWLRRIEQLRTDDLAIAKTWPAAVSSGDRSGHAVVSPNCFRV